MTIIDEISALVKERHFSIVRDRRGKGFGDALIEVESSKFDVLVVRDRGQISVSISPHGKSDWHDYNSILDFLRIKSSTVSEHFTGNVDRIATLMTGDLGKSGFAEFERKKAEYRLKKIFPNFRFRARE